MARDSVLDNFDPCCISGGSGCQSLLREEGMATYSNQCTLSWILAINNMTPSENTVMSTNLVPRQRR